MRKALIVFIAAMAAACAPSLGTFNALTPRDAGAQQVAADVAYGEGPRRTLDVYAPAGRPMGVRDGR